MRTFKTSLILFFLAIICLTLGSPAALASNIVIDKQTGPDDKGLFHTPDYTNDAACIQAALDYSKNGDTIIFRAGDYYITKRIYQKDKSLNIIGEGEVTLHIKTAESEIYGIFLTGSMVTNKKLQTNAQEGSSQVVLTDASRVRQNDLIKIWKNVQWCPLDYPEQMTGEMYSIKSVNGNVVTLNEPLLRDYSVSEAAQVEVYRPIQVQIQNIRVQDSGSTTSQHHGLVLQYCKDSSITNSWFKDSAFGAICLYSCFNVNVRNNEIYNSLLPGSGYGVNVASGSAFINIDHNHIENCRHAITGNSAELKSLNRDVLIADNTLVGASIAGSSVVDAHTVTIDYVVTGNKIYPKVPYLAFSDGTQQCIFSNNEIIGGAGGISRRGNINDGEFVYENNRLKGLSGSLYTGGGNGINKELNIRNNIQENGDFGIYFPSKESFKDIKVSGNSFSNLSHQGVYQKLQVKEVNVEISKNNFSNIKLEGIYIDGNSLPDGVVRIKNNILTNVYPSDPNKGITIKNTPFVELVDNSIFMNDKRPVAAFSASPDSGSVPLTVKFTDKSTGSPSSWSWDFGDGASSNQKNPSHTYSNEGKFTISLTVKNMVGSDTEKKSGLIEVSNLKPPVASFYGSRTSGKAPLKIRFTDKSLNNPTSWKWSFGDKTYSTSSNPSHTYSKAGKYPVSLTVKNAKGSSTKLRPEYIIVS